MISAALAMLENDDQRNELAEFYTVNKNRLYYIAFSKLHDPAEAEDAVQEAFSRIAARPERFFNIPDKSRVAYADVIVRNISIDMYNRRAGITAAPAEETELGDNTVSLEDELFNKISRDEILEFIDNLPELQRNVLILHCFLGSSIDETAEKLNISLTAANKRLTASRKAIRAFIEERGRLHE